jgi:hypothetical protein
VPPRFAYWTILIDDKPTAFRAQVRDELLPTLHQLRRTNPNAVMKWFARGRLWESPEDATLARRAPRAAPERRGRDWRPGGDHKDPRARFDKRQPKREWRRGGPAAASREGAAPPGASRRPRADRHGAEPKGRSPRAPAAGPFRRRRKPPRRGGGHNT